ncbi:MAG: metalloregulator ArsR/SmtB family transcription factor [Robiginitomaculum sp.]
MQSAATALKALGHPERLRIVALLARGELTVSELTQILSLSQPRVTQYIKTLEAAHIVERLKEGSWVFSRLSRHNPQIATLTQGAISALPQNDALLVTDHGKLLTVRKMRAKAAQDFFASLASNSQSLSAEYLPRGDIETHMRGLAGKGPFNFMVDLGTGTGRILEVFADRAARGAGIDSSPEMLAVARHNLSGQKLNHLTVRHGDLQTVPFDNGAADFVTLHQVLHYLDEPAKAIAEAGRLLSPGGALMIVDFDSHAREEFREQYAHRRLGFSDDEISAWMELAGLKLSQTRRVNPSEPLAPPVKLWLGKKSFETAP